jgi:membrane protease YdiL (CAAX protease family)
LKLTRVKLLLIAFAAEGVVFVLALLLADWLQIELDLATGYIVRELLIGLLATIPLVVLFIAMMSDYGDRFSVVGNLKRTMLQDVRPVFMQARFFDLLAIAVAAGVAEEVLFRGVIQTQLGLLPASILFGLVHFVTPAYGVAATLMGIYIGLIFSIFESLFAVILLHALYDLYALTYIRYRTAEPR